MTNDDDVPIRIDFRDLATARTWIEETQVERPYRPRFFAAFCAVLASRPKLRILELGSGPGQLARELLVHCDVHAYVVLDFSPAMHRLAAAHLGAVASRVTFVTRDFREPVWPGASARSMRSSRCRRRTRLDTSATSCRCSSAHGRCWSRAACCSTRITT